MWEQQHTNIYCCLLFKCRDKPCLGRQMWPALAASYGRPSGFLIWRPLMSTTQKNQRLASKVAVFCTSFWTVARWQLHTLMLCQFLRRVHQDAHQRMVFQSKSLAWSTCIHLPYLVGCSQAEIRWARRNSQRESHSASRTQAPTARTSAWGKGSVDVCSIAFRLGTWLVRSILFY